jgi:hypothetical protein
LLRRLAKLQLLQLLLLLPLVHPQQLATKVAEPCQAQQQLQAQAVHRRLIDFQQHNICEPGPL